MHRIALPDPPNPTEARYKDQPLAWQRAMYAWAQRIASDVQHAHNEVASPCGQQFLGTAFTTNTVATGTTTGTDLSNVVASLISTLTQKGILSPSITRGQSQ